MNLSDLKTSACDQAANELLNLNGWPKPRTLAELVTRYGIAAADIQAAADRMAARSMHNTEAPNA